MSLQFITNPYYNKIVSLQFIRNSVCDKIVSYFFYVVSGVGKIRMAIYGKNPWRCDGKCVTLHRKRTKRQAYDVFFLGKTTTEEVSGQAAMDAGRGVYLALHGAAAV